jgi:hypothetical protein
MWGEGVGGSVWYKYCVRIYVNGKMILIETVAGMREGR